MGFVSQEVHVVDSVILCQAQAVVIIIAIDVVRVDSIATLLFGDVQSGGHDPANVVTLDVQPVLSIPAIKTVAYVALAELIIVGSPVLRAAGGEVTDDFASLGLDVCHCFRGTVKQVNVPDINTIGGWSCWSILKLNLPCSTVLRLPDSIDGSTGASRWGRCWCRSRC